MRIPDVTATMRVGPVGHGSVVCDKPFALDAASARPAVLAAEAAGVVLTVDQNR